MRVQRTMQNAEDLEDPSPALRRVEVLEKERKQLEERLKSLEEKNASRDIISGLSRQNVKRLLSDVANSLEGCPSCRYARSPWRCSRPRSTRSRYPAM